MPDIHWHIGEDAEQETIAKTTSPRRSRRSWIAIVIVIVLGVGLGAVYRSIPEPAPRPTPLPSPTRPAVPAKLYEVIDREAQALASGAIETVMALHTPQEKQVAERQRLNFRAWGRPRDGSPLYTIIDFNLRSRTKAWADVRQFRNGRWFRETRFYRWEKDRWLRSEADPFFWSDQTETLDTSHFHVIYAVEDREFIQPVVDQLEQARSKLCADLGCTTTGLSYTLALNSDHTGGWPLTPDGRTLAFSSPRVMGVYEDEPPLGEEGFNMIWILAWTTAQRAAYGEVRDGSGWLVSAISRWAAMRAADKPDSAWLSEAKATLRTEPRPLANLWDAAQINDETSYAQAYAATHFIEQEYGAPAITKILKSMRTAQSFAEVVENGLGVPFAEFDQKWQAWIKQNTETPH